MHCLDANSTMKAVVMQKIRRPKIICNTYMEMTIHTNLFEAQDQPKYYRP